MKQFYCVLQCALYDMSSIEIQTMVFFTLQVNYIAKLVLILCYAGLPLQSTHKIIYPVQYLGYLVSTLQGS